MRLKRNKLYNYICLDHVREKRIFMLSITLHTSVKPYFQYSCPEGYNGLLKMQKSLESDSGRKYLMDKL